LHGYRKDTIYRNPDAGDQVRSFATDTLADYLSGNAERLFDLLADANEMQFGPMFDKLNNHREKATAFGNTEVSKTLATSASENSKEALAMRQANAAVMLLRMDAAENVWPLLKHSPDPRVRSYIIHWLSPRGGNSKTILARYEQETDVSIKRALLLCLGEFDESRLSETKRKPLIEILVGVYRSDPDAGLHAAAEWLLRTWKQGEKFTAIDKALQQPDKQLVEEKDSQRQWYINGQGQTFVILDADEFQMGSPKSEPALNLNTQLHIRKIGRRFAISAKEVTRSQWRRFSDSADVWWKADLEHLNEFIRSDDSPMVAMTWYEAAWYCNWLSEQEGIPENEWCYEPNSKGQYGPGMKAKDKFWELSGYRLPTEAEWEFTCRAGTSTSRYYGTSDKLLPKYSWYQDNTDIHTEPVATLKPNEFGVFDMLGNVKEWCYDEFKSYPVTANGVAIDNSVTSPVAATSSRVLRGGNYFYLAYLINSPSRGFNLPTKRLDFFGFRPARTLPQR
jgi:formylglycine-generating enzyme required for sulfatase activity